MQRIVVRGALGSLASGLPRGVEAASRAGVEFVVQGDFGLVSGLRPDGIYNRIWYRESMAPEEVSFEADVFLLTKARAQALKARAEFSAYSYASS